MVENFFEELKAKVGKAMHISPTHFPTFRTGALAAVLSAVALVSSAAQQLVVPEGSRVRLTWMSIDQGTPDWLVGEVTQTTSGNRLELLPEGRTQPTTVLMSESTRLQIYRGRRSNFSLGAGIGGAAGALVGGLFFSEGFGGRSSVGGSFEWTQSALAFGVAGATVGLVVAYIRGQERWEDQPLEDGRIPIPPLALAEASRPVPLRSAQRWERFDVTEDNFSAFFRRHADSLHPVEGVWRLLGQERFPFDAQRRFAVVRDARYADFEYVAIRFVWREGFNRSERSGSIFAALARVEEQGAFRVRYLGPRAGSGGRGVPAFQTGPTFIVQLGGNRPVEQWVKVLP